MKTLLIAALMVGVGCAHSTAKKYRKASHRLARDLVDQLEKRTDTRHVRVLVADFRPTVRPERDYYYYQHRQLARQLKQHMKTELARKVVVVEADPPDGRRGDQRVYERAKELGATTVLIGDYSLTGKDDIHIMTRLVETESYAVLATAERTIKNVD